MECGRPGCVMPQAGQGQRLAAGCWRMAAGCKRMRPGRCNRPADPLIRQRAGSRVVGPAVGGQRSLCFRHRGCSAKPLRRAPQHWSLPALCLLTGTRWSSHCCQSRHMHSISGACLETAAAQHHPDFVMLGRQHVAIQMEQQPSRPVRGIICMVARPSWQDQHMYGRLMHGCRLAGH